MKKGKKPTIAEAERPALILVSEIDKWEHCEGHQEQIESLQSQLESVQKERDGLEKNNEVLRATNAMADDVLEQYKAKLLDRGMG